MAFWHFLLNIGLLWHLVTVPTVNLTTIDYQSDINRISFLTQELAFPVAPKKIINDSLGVKLTARSALVADWDSGAILWQQQSAQAVPIASLTKLMTALVWLDFNPGWDYEVTIKESDYREGGRFYLFKGERVTTRDLFKSILISSDNNAAIALARSTGLELSDFILKMNEKAKQLRMLATVFVEPTGLHIGNISTAADILKLAQAAFSEEDILNVINQKEDGYFIKNTGRYNRLASTNQLLGSYLNIIAGKTGYSDEAGGCLVVLVQGDQDQKVIAIVLGSDNHSSRFQEVKSLVQWSFDNYSWQNKEEVEL